MNRFCLVLLPVVFLLPFAPVVGQQPTFDPLATARQILDDSNHDDLKSKLADDSLPHAAAVIAALAKDLPAGDRAEEYRRIPWIWRIAINATKRNDLNQQRQLLQLALPESDQALADWRAVVLGGGLINGLSQAGIAPRERIEELLAGSDTPREIAARWQRTVQLAAEIATQPQVPGGTRYDALRILGAANWSVGGAVLSRYLQPEADEELQMGAATAAADLTEPEATQTLLRQLSGLTPDNRNLAIEILASRTPQRKLLREAILASKVPRNWLTPEQLKQLEQ